MNWNTIERKPRQEANVIVWNENDNLVSVPAKAIYSDNAFRIRGLGLWYPIVITHWMYCDPPQLNDDGDIVKDDDKLL